MEVPVEASSILFAALLPSLVLCPTKLIESELHASQQTNPKPIIATALTKQVVRTRERSFWAATKNPRIQEFWASPEFFLGKQRKHGSHGCKLAPAIHKISPVRFRLPLTRYARSLLVPLMTAKQRTDSLWDSLSHKEKLAGYYHVHYIAGHQPDPQDSSNISYEVKWLGFNPKHNTLEPPEHLDGCVDLLRSYISRQRGAIEFPYGLTEKVGASSSTSNPDAWLTVDRVVDKIRMNLSKIFRSEAPIPALNFQPDLGERDALFILAYQHHEYIILFFSDHKYCLIADGENLHYNDANIRNHIDKLLPKYCTRPMHFIDNARQDQCGGAAI